MPKASKNYKTMIKRHFITPKETCCAVLKHIFLRMIVKSFQCKKCQIFFNIYYNFLYILSSFSDSPCYYRQYPENSQLSKKRLYFFLSCIIICCKGQDVIKWMPSSDSMISCHTKREKAFATSFIHHFIKRRAFL